MSIALLILVLVVLLIGASVVMGRATREVESARDTEYVELEGVWVRYAVSGGGPPVLLVHDWLSSSRVWDGLVARLSGQFTVYTLDLTGFGESDKPLSGYGIRNGSRLLYAFCAHFGLTGVGVVGHGFGGDMAAKLAADRPDVVGKLALSGVPSSGDEIDLPTFLWLATLPVIGPLVYALGRWARPIRRLWMRPFVLEKEDLTDQVLDDSSRSTPAAIRKTLLAARRELAGERLSRQAGRVRVPVLAIAGEEDRIVEPLAVEIWGGVMGQSEIHLIEGCGHLPMIERPEEFEPHILAFLSGRESLLESDPGEQSLAPEEAEVAPPGESGEPESDPEESPAQQPPEDESEPSDHPEARKKRSPQERIPRFPGDLFEWPDSSPTNSGGRRDDADEKPEDEKESRER